MRATFQRVNGAKLHSNEQQISQIDSGLIVLVGCCIGDDKSNADKLIKRIMNVRLFNDENNKINLSINDTKKSVMLISNFTLCTKVSSGSRPDFGLAMKRDEALSLYNYIFDTLKQNSVDVHRCAYGEHMTIESILDGPITYNYEC